MNKFAAELGIADHLAVLGRPSCLIFATRDAEGLPSQPFRTLFLQELLVRGVLGQSFVTSAAHTDTDVDATIDACRAGGRDLRPRTGIRKRRRSAAGTPGGAGDPAPRLATSTLIPDIEPWAQKMRTLADFRPASSVDHR